jgi:hypothetical protein
MSTIETVDVYGVSADGTQTKVGTMPMPPSMKAREIVRTYFHDIDEENGSDGAMALWACNELVSWMEQQGWTPPPITDIKPREDTVANQWRNFRDCPKCGAEKGSACRTPSCVQLQQAPVGIRLSQQ